MRETARHAYKNPPIKFAKLDEALAYAGSRLKIPMAEYVRRSRLLKQRKLFEF